MIHTSYLQYYQVLLEAITIKERDSKCAPRHPRLTPRHELKNQTIPKQLPGIAQQELPHERSPTHASTMYERARNCTKGTADDTSARRDEALKSY